MDSTQIVFEATGDEILLDAAQLDMVLAMENLSPVVVSKINEA